MSEEIEDPMRPGVSPPCPTWRDPSSLLLFAFVAIVLAVRTRYSVYDDLIFSYPYIGWDGFEWITERLHYLDPTIEIMHRNPGLPLILAGLDAFGALRFFPVLQALSFFAFVVALHGVVRQFVSPPLASFAVLTTFLCFKLHSTFDHVLADGWALLFMTASVHFLFGAREKPRLFVLASGAAALSFVFQFAVAFIAPAYLYYVLVGPVSRVLRARWPICLGAGVVFAVIALPQIGYTLFLFGTFIPPTKNPVRIVGFHLFGLFYYFVNTLAWIGVPSTAAISTGLASSARSARAEVRFVHLATASTFVFWVLFYRWLDQRFVIYFVPFFAVYFALGVERLIRSIAGLGTGARRFAATATAAFWLVGASVTAAPLPLYTYDLLPLAPGWVVRFHPRIVGDFGGNVNITLDPAPEHAGFPEWGKGYRAHYRRRWKMLERVASLPLRDELVEAGLRVRQGVPRGAEIAICTDALWVHELRHRILHSLKRNLRVSCDERAGHAFAERASHTPPAGARVLHEGERFVLYARPSPRTAADDG